MAIVQRSPADKPGIDIVSSVLTTAPAQVERGRQEINYSMYDRRLLTGTTLKTDFVRPGDIVQIQENGESQNGKSTGFNLRISRSQDSIDCTVTIVTDLTL